MPDIFVSYAREDHDWVSLFTSRLREVGGWDIWWDLKLLPGEQFDDAIEKALGKARCVIVIWSQHSIDSRWVRSEAREGAQKGTLVPLRIESVTPPLEFRSFETSDMSKWGGDGADADFTEIVHVVRHAIDRTPAQTVTIAPQRGPAPSQARATHRWFGGVAVAIAIFMGIGLATRGGTPFDSTVASSLATLPASTMVPAAHLGSTPRRLPELSYGTWTLRDAVDAHGGNWSNSTIKFTSQETTSDGLTIKGTMTWRLGDLLDRHRAILRPLRRREPANLPGG